MGSDEIMEELMEMRSEFLVHHAFDGFGMTWEDALEILRKEESLTNEEAAKRNVIVAAVDNLVDFAVAQEYQMTQNLPDFEELDDWDIDPEEIEDEEGEDNPFILVFAKYNKQYAAVENADVYYAMLVASGLVGVAETTTLTYMTQGDERVRPWHLQYEGYSAPKHRFPAWLVPPIEHQCRCYLVEDTEQMEIGGVQDAMVQVPQMPFWFNRTFKECVAFGGRIFSDEHPYFNIGASDNERLQAIAERIKDKLYGKS